VTRFDWLCVAVVFLGCGLLLLGVAVEMLRRIVKAHMESTAVTSRDDSVLESRVPDLNPWSGSAVVALHSHTADEPCDERCSIHERLP